MFRRPARGVFLILASALPVVSLLAMVAWPSSAAPPTSKETAPHVAHEGGLSFDVRDTQTDRGIPCKLTLVGVGGAPDPELTRVDVGREEDHALMAWNRIMSLTGLGAVHVPYGTYDVTVSRGPEWDTSTFHT